MDFEVKISGTRDGKPLKQNAETGAYDSKAAELIEFIDFEETGESPEEYLDRLIQEASKNWEDVEDPEAWLREIRGYDD